MKPRACAKKVAKACLKASSRLALLHQSGFRGHLNTVNHAWCLKIFKNSVWLFDWSLLVAKMTNQISW